MVQRVRSICSSRFEAWTARWDIVLSVRCLQYDNVKRRRLGQPITVPGGGCEGGRSCGGGGLGGGGSVGGGGV